MTTLRENFPLIFSHQHLQSQTKNRVPARTPE